MKTFVGAMVFAIGAFVAPRSEHAQSASADPIDTFVRAEMARRHIPGVAIAVVRAGKTVRAAGYGVSDIENNVMVTPNTVFKIGSVSKQFIATGIMLLAQEGKLSVDDPVSKFYPNAPASWSGITLRHFLTHTSGVLREGPAFNPLVVQADSLIVRSAFDRALEFPTGSKYQYCNVCYFTLADVVARLSNATWDTFLAERVFKPAGMTATRTTTISELVPLRARGYVWKTDRYQNAAEYLALRPSGAFLSTVVDLAKWDAELYQNRLLTQTTRDQMWKPVKLTGGEFSGYGFGWQLDSMDGHWRVHHGGTLPGFRAEMARFPNDSLTVIVLTNADSGAPAAIAEGIAKLYFGGKVRP